MDEKSSADFAGIIIRDLKLGKMIMFTDGVAILSDGGHDLRESLAKCLSHGFNLERFNRVTGLDVKERGFGKEFYFSLVDMIELDERGINMILDCCPQMREENNA